MWCAIGHAKALLILAFSSGTYSSWYAVCRSDNDCFMKSSGSNQGLPDCFVLCSVFPGTAVPSTVQLKDKRTSHTLTLRVCVFWHTRTVQGRDNLSDQSTRKTHALFLRLSKRVNAFEIAFMKRDCSSILLSIALISFVWFSWTIDQGAFNKRWMQWCTVKYVVNFTSTSGV